MSIHHVNYQGRCFKVRTDFIYPPIPVRGYDWQAVDDNYEPGRPIGYGRTEADAIDDLIEAIDEDMDMHPGRYE